MKIQLKQLVFYFATTMAFVVLLSAHANAQRSMNTGLSDFIPADDPYCHDGEDDNFVSRTTVTGSDTPGDRGDENISPCEDITLSVGNDDDDATTDDAPFPASVVDWVLVDLRQAGTAEGAAVGGVVARKPALLLSNGRVVDAAGFIASTGADPENTACAGIAEDETNCPAVQFGSDAFGTGSPEDGNYFIVIHHRNHASVMTAAAVTVTGSAGAFDFADATAPDAIFGSTSKMVSGNPPVLAALAGDSAAIAFGGTIAFRNKDNGVLPSDFLGMFPRSAQGGYNFADINMDQTAAPSDWLPYLSPSNNLSLGTGITVQPN